MRLIYIFILLFVSILIAAKPAAPVQTIHFENSNGDSVGLNVSKYKNIIIVYAMEPACTGCKESLSALLKKYNSRSCPVYVVGNSNQSIESRKQSEIFMLSKFPYAKQLLFVPASGISTHMKTIDSTLKASWHKTPFMVICNSNGSKTCFTYDDIFTGMNVKITLTPDLNKALNRK